MERRTAERRGLERRLQNMWIATENRTGLERRTMPERRVGERRVVPDRRRH
jgi:hypothetical protein